MEPKTQGQPPVEFTIDGITYSLTERRQTAEALMLLAGVDPKKHTLARVVGQSKLKNFDDSEEIQITPGAQFVTIFDGPTPVV